METSGLFPSLHDRVAEVPAVELGNDDDIERKLESFVNSAGNIGPSSIGGSTADDVLYAPQCLEIASRVLDKVRGVVTIV